MKPQCVTFQIKATEHYLYVEWSIVLSLFVDETQVSICLKFTMWYVNVALFVVLYKEHE